MNARRHVALVADDDEFFRMAIRSILLQRLGMEEVIETGSLDEALEGLSEHGRITAALFDLAMPGMESPASLGAVRELFPAIRVIVVSGSERREDILTALEVGVHGYIPKGLGVDELASALRLVLDGIVYVPPSLPEIAREEREAGVFRRAPAASADQQLASLSVRQREVLELLVAGKSNKEIARDLDLGGGTVKVHLAALFRHLGVNNRAAAAAMGARLLAERP